MMLNEAARMVAANYRRPRLAPVWISCIVVAVDLPVFSLAAWFAQYAVMAAGDFRPLVAVTAAAACAICAGLCLAATGRYDHRILRRPLRATIHAVLAASAPAVVLATVVDEANGALLVAASACAVATFFLPLRLFCARAILWLSDSGLTARRAVIAGGGEHAASLIRALNARPGNDIQFCAIFDARDEERSPPQMLGVPKIGGFDDLIGFVRSAEIDLVIIALPLEAKARIDWLLKRLRVLPVEVRLSAFNRNYDFGQGSGDLVAAMLGSFGPERRLTKRLFDLAIASVVLVVLSPLFAVAALAIRLESPGPVFFRQQRHSYNHRVINVLKFRSMYHGDSDPDARQIVTRGDPRVTRVGRLLRKSSIDELPQLINVLRGDLSLVGPRPHAVVALTSGQKSFEQIVDGYSARHRLPAGITGWAQIHGWRGEIDDPVKLRRRVEHDLYYIENWSIWLDIRILLRTPFCLLDTSAAY